MKSSPPQNWEPLGSILVVIHTIDTHILTEIKGGTAVGDDNCMYFKINFKRGMSFEGSCCLN